jgi:alpha-D-xyloside xylohydrolase
VCGHGAINLPNALTCRLDGLVKGERLALEFSSNMTGVKVSVSSGASYDRLALRSEHSSAADFYVFAADDSESTLDSVIAGYRRATGVAYQYARWVYGFWQCREHYATQAELLEAAALMRAHKVPVDAIVQDWHYWGELGWAPQWDHKIYPDPAGMVEELRKQNLHLMISVWSKFEEVTHFYDELVANRFQIPGTNWLDPWNPEARRQFYEWADEAHFRIGIDSLWLDATEPEGNVQRGRRVFGNQSAEALLNTYSLMVAKAVYDGLVRRDARRVFSLTRSSFAGQQRYGATIWSGDTLGAWDTLPRQVAMSVNYQLSGIPYWSMDIGGFFRPDDQYASEDYHALLTRWFQFGAFVPVMRVHGAGSHTELWHYGNDTMKRIVESAIDLRYRLLDYVYSGYREVEARHYTMQRGLVLDFFHDPAVFNIADQFMFGPLLMVAPVTTRDPRRHVYLPSPFGKSGGGFWRDFYTGQKLETGWHEERNVSLDRIPLFVRSGILVLSPKAQHSAERTAGAPLEVRVYAGRDAKFSLFEDDGADADVGRAMSWIDFEWSDQTRALTIADRRGTLAEGVPKERRIEVVLVRPGLGVGVQRNAAPDMVLQYKGTHMLARLPKPPTEVEELQLDGDEFM